MQWDKVKNVLIVILLAVNLFLLGNLGFQYHQRVSRAAELNSHVRTLLAESGVTLDESFRLPDDKVLPPLTLDRSRADEERVARAMLGADMQRTEREDGTVLFESDLGEVAWNGDGTVQGHARDTRGAPEGVRQAEQRLRASIRDWGLLDKGDSISFAEGVATLTGPVAGLPVHNRSLQLTYEGETVSLTGFWSFGTPYTTARETVVNCAAADALLAFAASTPDIGQIQEMTVGYRLQQDSGRRLQLTPTWKIRTSEHEYLVDCAKKTEI